MTCFDPICRAIFRLIFRQVECKNCTLHLSKDQPEDGPTNRAETCHWNYNLIQFNKIQIYVWLYYIFFILYFSLYSTQRGYLT